VAAELADRGIGRGDNVAIMLPTSRDFFLVFAGILLAGATPTPIYPPFRADRIAEYAERQSAILANAGARLLVTFREAEHVARLLKPRVASLEAVATATALIESRAAAPLGAQLHSRGEDLALLQYTSGSTGNPKGVMLSHANLLANVRAIGEALAIRSDDVGVSWLPLYHDMGLIGAWLMPLYFGLPVVIQSPLAFLARPVRWLRAFDRYRGTIGAAPNFAYELAAAKVSEADLEGLDLSSWRAALNGAEPVLPATLDRFAERFARNGFRRETLLPVYGLAESSVALAIPPPGRGPRVDRVERAMFEREGRAEPSLGESNGEESDVISFVSVGSAIPRHDVRIRSRGRPALVSRPVRDSRLLPERVRDGSTVSCGRSRRMDQLRRPRVPGRGRNLHYRTRERHHHPRWTQSLPSRNRRCSGAGGGRAQRMRRRVGRRRSGYGNRASRRGRGNSRARFCS
jgi:acyl-CoA synthetase (AMP-forming)/AMP-acid ligase II